MEKMKCPDAGKFVTVSNNMQVCYEPKTFNACKICLMNKEKESKQ